MEWLCLLVKGEVSVAQKWFGWIARIPNCDGRKKACLGHYKKSFFGSAKKPLFFCSF